MKGANSCKAVALTDEGTRRLMIIDVFLFLAERRFLHFLGGVELISIEGLRKHFTSNKNKITAVDDLTLTIQEGEIFGVIGYSGACMSTFVHMLNRLEDIQAVSYILGYQVNTHNTHTPS